MPFIPAIIAGIADAAAAAATAATAATEVGTAATVATEVGTTATAAGEAATVGGEAATVGGEAASVGGEAASVGENAAGGALRDGINNVVRGIKLGNRLNDEFNDDGKKGNQGPSSYDEIARLIDPLGGILSLGPPNAGSLEHAPLAGAGEVHEDTVPDVVDFGYRPSGNLKI